MGGPKTGRRTHTSAHAKRWATTGQRRRTGSYIALGVAALLFAAGLFAWQGARGDAPGVRPHIRHVHGMAADPYDPGRLYVATHDGLWVWREPDGWQGRVGPVIDLMGFSLGAAAGELFSSGHPGPGARMPNPVGLIRSRDGGRSWEILSLAGEVDFHAMAVSPAGPRRVYGFFYGLFCRSDDGGLSWSRQRIEALAAPDGRGPLQLVAHPTDPDTLLAAGASGLLRSTDGGRSWETLLPGPVTSAAFVPRDPQGLLAYQLERGLVRSPDGGRTWQPLGFRVEGRDSVAFLTVHPIDPGTVYAATFAAALLRSRDGGRTWQPLE